MAYLLGLDVGTSGAKAILISEDGRVAGSAFSEYPMSTPYPLWAEQNPGDWWKSSVESFKKILSFPGIKAADIRGIGLTGQMHGLVLLDPDGNVLRPCIMWNDQRTWMECKEMTSLIGFEQLIKITGNPVLPGFTAPKLLWVKKNEPETYKKIAHILLPKDYVRYRLTGEFATDVSDASGTSLLDVNKRSWSKTILDKLEIPLTWMPELYESAEVSGKVTAVAEKETGICSGTLVAAGGGDQAAGGVGTGTVKNGVTSVVLGTSGVVFSHTDKLTIEPEGRLHAFCHAVPQAWHVMGVTLSAAGSFKWFKNVLGQSEQLQATETGADVYDILTKEAEIAPPGSEGLIFLPYLSGERTPYPDPDAKGSFIGLTLRHNKPHIVRSILEGIAYSLRDCLELTSTIGIDTQQVRISGGGARSKFWRQILADVFNKELVTLNSTEGAPFGAALIASVAAGFFNSIEEACLNSLSVESRIEPKLENVRIYNDFYPIYGNLYDDLKDTFSSISSTVAKYLQN